MVVAASCSSGGERVVSNREEVRAYTREEVLACILDAVLLPGWCTLVVLAR